MQSCGPALRLATLALLFNLTATAAELRVMTFNLWHGGDAGKLPLERSADVIRQARADLVGLQETGGFEKTKGAGRPDHGRRLAEIMGWRYFDQGAHTGVLSRFPIVTNTPRRWGVTIQHPSGVPVRLFNVHLMHAPYQPYQLLRIPYEGGPFIQTADQAVTEARRARGGQVDQLRAELEPVIASGEPVFLTGDFNEPSHQDWTRRAAAAGRCPVAVEYPATLAITKAGLRDAYRTVFPDEITRPGSTWTPTTLPTDPKDRHDRIDFVFVGGRGVGVTRCEVVGEASAVADIVVQPYPSDHRAVVATVTIH